MKYIAQPYLVTRLLPLPKGLHVLRLVGLDGLQQDVGHVAEGQLLAAAAAWPREHAQHGPQQVVVVHEAAGAAGGGRTANSAAGVEDGGPGGSEQTVQSTGPDPRRAPRSARHLQTNKRRRSLTARGQAEPRRSTGVSHSE